MCLISPISSTIPVNMDWIWLSCLIGMNRKLDLLALKRRDKEGDDLRSGVTFKWVKELWWFNVEVFGGNKLKNLETQVEEEAEEIDIFSRG